jgi:dipeptidyl aminopeptidase/acylaminoacyl peptidase
MTDEKRLITAEDLYKLELISGLEISPDGKNVIYAQQRVDEKTEKKYSNLWIVPTDGSASPHQFTYGDQTDNNPRWSPDGSQIAFISNRKDEKQPQLYLIPFAGGEARPLTDLKGQINSYEWSPDGSKLVMQFRKKDAEAVEREEDEQKKKLGIVERHYKRIFYKSDGAGFLPQERWHIWVVDAGTGEVTQLTESEIFDETTPTWSPDGKWITFLSNRSDDPDLEREAIDLCVIPAEGGELRLIPTPIGRKQFPSFSPDGKQIAYIGTEGKGDWWKNDTLWIVPFDGSASARELAREFDINIAECTLNDVNGGAANMVAPLWSLDGQRLYFQVSKHGSTTLHAIKADSSGLETIIGDEGVVGVFNFDRDRSKLACFLGTMTHPGDIQLLDLGNGKSQKLTHTNAWLDSIDLGTVEQVWFKGRENNDLQGWVLKPPGFDSSRKYPSIMEIHGGPLAQYGNFFMHEFYYLAAQGYVVSFSNPRGGQGYGEDHAKANWSGWGDADYADLMLWADYMKSQPYIDTQKMGVTGGSYGGYMTLWIIGHTNQFKSAVAQRVVSNFVSMWGSSDLNYVFQEVFGGKPPYEDLQKAWKHSPMAYIGNAKTPTLIIHSEHDHRCPIEQGEQAFVALKTQGVDSEMVRYPDEPHGLSRLGRTDRRISRLNHISRWMDKYLKSS